MGRGIYFVALVVMLSSISCGVVKDEDADDENKTSACLSLVNGRSTNDFKSVVMLLSTDSLCTGTFISHNLLLTASHCLDDSLTGGKRYVEGSSFAKADLAEAYSNGTEPLRFYSVGPKSGDGSVAKQGEQDLALVIFPDFTAPDTSPLRAANPSKGETVTLVGFGITKVTTSQSGDGCSSYNKRTGTNELLLASDLAGLYYQGRAETNYDSGKTTDAVNASGDSGGPVFINGKVAGVVSAAGRLTSDSGSSHARSYAVDLKVSQSKNFIQSVLDEEPDLEIIYE